MRHDIKDISIIRQETAKVHLFRDATLLSSHAKGAHLHRDLWRSGTLPVTNSDGNHPGYDVTLKGLDTHAPEQHRIPAAIGLTGGTNVEVGGHVVGNLNTHRRTRHARIYEYLHRLPVKHLRGNVGDLHRQRPTPLSRCWEWRSGWRCRRRRWKRGCARHRGLAALVAACSTSRRGKGRTKIDRSCRRWTSLRHTACPGAEQIGIVYNGGGGEGDEDDTGDQYHAGSDNENFVCGVFAPVIRQLRQRRARRNLPLRC